MVISYIERKKLPKSVSSGFRDGGEGGVSSTMRGKGKSEMD